MSPTADDQVKRALYTELCRTTRPVAVQRIVSSLQNQQLVVDNRDATVVVQRLGKCSLWDSALDAVMRLACPGLLQPDAVLLGAMVTACGRGNAWTQHFGCSITPFDLAVKRFILWFSEQPSSQPSRNFPYAS